MRNKYIIILIGVALIIIAGYILSVSPSPSKNTPELNGGSANMTIQKNDPLASTTKAEDTTQAPPASADTNEASLQLHIMADGKIMDINGEEVVGARILEDGRIQTSNGAIVVPAADLRSKASSETTVAKPNHVVIDIVGIDFSYDIKQIKVKKGDTVTINFRSNKGFHDWVIDEFNARTDRVNEGGVTSVTFVADKLGTFQYYCSVMNHRQLGMVGYLVVE